MQDGMGDWCPPRWDRRLNPSAMECDPIISANAYFYDVLGIMETFAKMNNDSIYEVKMRQEKEALQKSFNKAFLVEIPGTTYKWYQSQTATVQALQFDMVPENEIENVVNGLVHDIAEVKGGHHATGIHGNRYIYTVLTKFGQADLAHQILTTPDFPSQTYVMNSGFTTWPERQFEWETMEGPTNSLNHPMHSGFSAYFYESLGGIKSSKVYPGYKEFLVKPEFSDKINETEVVIPTPYGKIGNAWKINNGNLTMRLDVPFNTKARLVLTKKEFESLKINGQSFADFSGSDKEIFNEFTHVKLGSGNYQIEFLKEEDKPL
jgi:alpha-L-rhamnosidase